MKGVVKVFDLSTPFHVMIHPQGAPHPVKKKPDIRSYSDYRLFLKDYVAQKQSTHPRSNSWTYGTWCRQLHISSPSTLTMIIKGHRHPGPKLVERLVRYFSFDDDEAAFFRSLIGIQKRVGDDPRLTVFLLKKLTEGDTPKMDDPVESLQDILFRRSSYILREMTLLDDFRENPEWIAARTGGDIDPRSAAQLLKNLEEAELLERKGKDGTLIPKQSVRKNMASPAQEKVHALHRELLSATERALSEVPESERSFQTSFLNIRKEQIEEARTFLREFQREFSARFEARPGEEVYQLNLHLFPATRNSESKRKSAK